MRRWWEILEWWLWRKRILRGWNAKLQYIPGRVPGEAGFRHIYYQGKEMGRD